MVASPKKRKKPTSRQKDSKRKTHCNKRSKKASTWRKSNKKASKRGKAPTSLKTRMCCVRLGARAKEG